MRAPHGSSYCPQDQIAPATSVSSAFMCPSQQTTMCPPTPLGFHRGRPPHPPARIQLPTRTRHYRLRAGPRHGRRRRRYCGPESSDGVRTSLAVASRSPTSKRNRSLVTEPRRYPLPVDGDAERAVSGRSDHPQVSTDYRHPGARSAYRITAPSGVERDDVSVSEVSGRWTARTRCSSKSAITSCHRRPATPRSMHQQYIRHDRLRGFPFDEPSRHHDFLCSTGQSNNPAGAEPPGCLAAFRHHPRTQNPQNEPIPQDQVARPKPGSASSNQDAGRSSTQSTGSHSGRSRRSSPSNPPSSRNSATRSP